jgi:hypothetical protein
MMIALGPALSAEQKLNPRRTTVYMFNSLPREVIYKILNFSIGGDYPRLALVNRRMCACVNDTFLDYIRNYCIDNQFTSYPLKTIYMPPNHGKGLGAPFMIVRSDDPDDYLTFTVISGNTYITDHGLYMTGIRNRLSQACNNRMNIQMVHRYLPIYVTILELDYHNEIKGSSGIVECYIRIGKYITILISNITVQVKNGVVQSTIKFVQKASNKCTAAAHHSWIMAFIEKYFPELHELLAGCWEFKSWYWEFVSCAAIKK